MIEPLFEALLPVLNVLDQLGVRHFVGGSIASSAHGIARSSLDADVVTELSARDVRPFIAALEGAYYFSEARIADAVSRRGSFNLIHLSTTLKVDVFVSRDRPADRRAFERAQVRPLAGGDALVRMSSAEDVVLAKLEWYREGGETSERQWTDVLGVLKAGGRNIDRSYLARGAEERAVADLLQRALDKSDG
jgi:hypothetical protein